MEDAFEWKREKYEGLVRDCHRQGLRVRCLPVEALQGNRSALGIMGKRRRRAIHNNKEATESTLRWVWIKRSDQRKVAARTQTKA